MHVIEIKRKQCPGNHENRSRGTKNSGDRKTTVDGELQDLQTKDILLLFDTTNTFGSNSLCEIPTPRRTFQWQYTLNMHATHEIKCWKKNTGNACH